MRVLENENLSFSENRFRRSERSRPQDLSALETKYTLRSNASVEPNFYEDLSEQLGWQLT